MNHGDQVEIKAHHATGHVEALASRATNRRTGSTVKWIACLVFIALLFGDRVVDSDRQAADSSVLRDETLVDPSRFAIEPSSAGEHRMFEASHWIATPVVWRQDNLQQDDAQQDDAQQDNAQQDNPDESETVRALVGDLDHDQFFRRETVTRELIGLGSIVVPHLVESMPFLSREGQARAYYVLHQLAADEDATVARPAREALVLLSSDPSPQLAGSARRSLAVLDNLRSLRLAELLRQHGAIITHRFVVLDGQYARVPDLITFDERWTGDADLLTHFAWINHIPRVSLIGDTINDEMVKSVMANDHLVYVNIQDAPLSNAALHRASRDESNARLSGLRIRYCPIGDEAIEHVGTIRSLDQVELFGTRVTDDGARRLREMLPTADIDHRKGGFLGVRCAVSDHICRVTSVDANSAAAKSGIRIGDIIVLFNGQEVSGIDNLLEKTRNHAPGEVVEIEIMRNGRPLVITCVLGRSVN